MAKTSKTVPKNDKDSSSSASRPAKSVVPPTLEEITPGLDDESEMRPAPTGEKTKPSNLKSEKYNKRKRVSKPEDPQDREENPKSAQTGADSAHDSLDDKENDDEESALVTRTGKPVEAAKPSKLETSSRGEGVPKEQTGKALVSPEVEIVPPLATTISEGVNAETPNANEKSLSEDLGAAITGHSISLPTYF
ncbi:uncharacterized protein [Nicotiana sylvestris]|uniref:uncharacterized protein n=1 Tax=Nicotiana sylvestris TaxID=4096 RepID=UPI00388C4B80